MLKRKKASLGDLLFIEEKFKKTQYKLVFFIISHESIISKDTTTNILTNVRNYLASVMV